MTSCFALGCGHKGVKCRLFRFTSDEHIRQKWISLCGGTNRQYSASDRICSCHFRDGLKENGPSRFFHRETINPPVEVPFLPESSQVSIDFLTEERSSMSQVVFSDLLALLLNCSTELFVNRLVELQSVAKTWSSCELESCDTETTKITETETLNDSGFDIQPPEFLTECTVKLEVEDVSSPQGESCTFLSPTSGEDPIKSESISEAPALGGDSLCPSKFINNIRKTLTKKQANRLIAKRQNCIRKLRSINIAIQQGSSKKQATRLVVKRQNWLRKLRSVNITLQQISSGKLSTKPTETTKTSNPGSCENRKVRLAKFNETVLSLMNKAQLVKSASVAVTPSLSKELVPSKLQLRKCPICDVELASKVQVKKHINDVHFLTIRAVMEDKRTETTARFDCPDCDKVLSTADSLRRHKINKHGAEGNVKEKRMYTCELCGVTLAAASAFRRHIILIHTPPTYQKYVCGDCGREFKLKQGLRKHINGVHLKLRPHLCSICGDRFLSHTNLQTHTKLVHRDRSK